MEDENLTTGEEPQVNVEEQASVNVDNSLPDEVPAEDTNQQSDEYKTAYDDVWDRDINDTSILEEDTTTVIENPLQVDEFQDTSTNDTNNSIGAFMIDKPVLKFKGKDVPIENKEELIALAQKGFLLETEMSNIKPQKKMLKIVDGIPLEVLQAVADLNSGDTGAINYLKDRYGIKEPEKSEDNFWESDKPATEEKPASYTPEVKADDPIADFWNDYTANNQVAAAKVNEIYSGLEESFKAELYQPNVFPAFVQSVESGEFDSVYPIAVKEKALNPAMSWIQAYQLAVQKTGTAPVSNEPPAEATPPKQQDAGRHMSAESAADRVWNDPDYFNQLDKKIFGY